MLMVLEKTANYMGRGGAIWCLFLFGPKPVESPVKVSGGFSWLACGSGEDRENDQVNVPIPWISRDASSHQRLSTSLDCCFSVWVLHSCLDLITLSTGSTLSVCSILHKANGFWDSAIVYWDPDWLFNCGSGGWSHLQLLNYSGLFCYR